MTPLRQRMIEDMQLRGFSERTQEAYLRAVRQLAAHYGKSPDQITEEELRQYFLYNKMFANGPERTAPSRFAGLNSFLPIPFRENGPLLN